MSLTLRLPVEAATGSDGFVITFTCDICHTTRTSTITGQAMAATATPLEPDIPTMPCPCGCGRAFALVVQLLNYELDAAKLAGCACPS